MKLLDHRIIVAIAAFCANNDLNALAAIFKGSSPTNVTQLAKQIQNEIGIDIKTAAEPSGLTADALLLLRQYEMEC